MWSIYNQTLFKKEKKKRRHVERKKQEKNSTINIDCGASFLVKDLRFEYEVNFVESIILKINFTIRDLN